MGHEAATHLQVFGDELGIQDTSETGELPVRPACGDHPLIDRLDVAVRVLTCDTHLGQKIAGTDMDHVDSLDRRDLFDVLDCRGRFDHDGNKHIFVHQFRRLGHRHGLEAKLPIGAHEGAMADGGKLAVGHDVAGLFFRVDVRHDDTHCAAIEHTAPMKMLMTWDPHDRRDAGVQRSDTDFMDALVRQGAMLHVDKEPVVITALCNLDDIHRAQGLHDHSDNELPPPQLLEGGVRRDGH